MRPNDPRYSALPLPGKAAADASVRCVVLCWPVIDPLGRYQSARKKKEAGDAKQANEWISCHDQYFQGGEAEMAEGNPTMAWTPASRCPHGTVPPALPPRVPLTWK